MTDDRDLDVLGEPPDVRSTSEPQPEAEPTPTAAPAKPPRNMVPARERRRYGIERGLVRIIATGGIVGIAVALGAILSSSDVAGWTVGLVIGLTSVILAAVLWSSRQL